MDKSSKPDKYNINTLIHSENAAKHNEQTTGIIEMYMCEYLGIT